MPAPEGREPLRQKKNRHGTGEDMGSQLQDFFDRFGK
jgi:hypothetical protein